MTDIQRVKTVANWLIFINYAQNEKEIAEKLGYTKSSFSQIINGKVPLSKRFVQKLCLADSRINRNWILTGKGGMLMQGYLESTPDSAIGEKGMRYGKETESGDLKEGTDMKILIDLLRKQSCQLEELLARISDLIDLQRK